MRSIVRQMGLDLVVPDYSAISRRGKGLKIVQDRRPSDEPITLIVDSTGLKTHGGNCWHEEKHGTRKAHKTLLSLSARTQLPGRGRKLQIALNSATGAIAATQLTTEHVGDETALPDLRASIDADTAQFLADGAYDGQGVADYLLDKLGSGIEIMIPPPKSAVHDANIQRNQHIDAIAKHSRVKWQTKARYN